MNMSKNLEENEDIISNLNRFKTENNDQNSYIWEKKYQQIGEKLVVKPVLLYNLMEKKQALTWREWGGLHSQEDVEKETKRIQNELKELVLEVDYPISILPLTEVNTDKKSKEVVNTDCDVILLYAAGSAGDEIYKQNRIDQITNSNKDVLMFLRHKSGPTYLWYKKAHPRLLRNGTDKFEHDNMTYKDIVVDDYSGVTKRLRSLFGLKNVNNTKVLSINGVGKAGQDNNIVKNVKSLWGLDIETLKSQELKDRMYRSMGYSSKIGETKKRIKKFLDQDNIIEVEAEEEYILSSFILLDVLKDLMKETDSTAITIKDCMNLGELTGTTACLPFSLINDEGLMAFCESDFTAIPAGILMRFIANKPVFMNNPTFPHDGMTTCANCTAPRRMNGKEYEAASIFTHFESDYGAAPKVQFHQDQLITSVIPDFDSEKWLGFKGKVEETPFYDICRSQMDCKIEGDYEQLLKNMRGFHWLTCYGDYLEEFEYALHKIGINFENISAE